MGCKWGNACGDCGDDGTGWCHRSADNCAACTGTFDPSTPTPDCGNGVTSPPTESPTLPRTQSPTPIAAPATWTMSELVSNTDKQNPDTCYIAIFAGDECSSDGGVYKVSRAWYSEHYGGNFGVLGSCGEVITFWLRRSGSHEQFASSLAANSDLGTSSLGTLATFTANLACESTSQPSNEPTPLPTLLPTPSPTFRPTRAATPSPTPAPTPTPSPTSLPTSLPTPSPTLSPTTLPTPSPTPTPTASPTLSPMRARTPSPTPSPTPLPTPTPMASPTPLPTLLPTPSLTDPTTVPVTAPTPTPVIEPTPSATCSALWAQCGGSGWAGPECCVAGSACVKSHKWYSQCKPTPSATCSALWGQCGGSGWAGRECCVAGSACVKFNKWYSQCRPAP